MLLPTLTAFQAMNFKGATVYTSLSGALKEMKFAIPLTLLAGIAGVGAGVASVLLET